MDSMETITMTGRESSKPPKSKRLGKAESENKQPTHREDT